MTPLNDVLQFYSIAFGKNKTFFTGRKLLKPAGKSLHDSYDDPAADLVEQKTLGCHKLPVRPTL